ncbi:DUF2953 domain-containing protein [Bacillaceae bacterium Marseille-Q3522]|nr:DUF2953 domain-containing protein [Bacillaceae bacterium Marseille-Q3522]
MKWLLFGILFLLFCFLLVALTKITVKIDYLHRNNNNELTIFFQAWFKLISYKISIPVLAMDQDSPTLIMKQKTEMGKKEGEKKKKVFTAEDFWHNLRKTEKLFKHIIHLHKIIRQFLNKLKIKKLEWTSHIGVGEAAYTAILAGAIWTAKGSLLGFLSNYMRLETKPNVMIYPHFQAVVSQTSFSCMIQFRIGHAILAGLKMIFYWKGNVKSPSFVAKKNI